MVMESYTTGTGQHLWVHNRLSCDADPKRDIWCVIHARKPGRMQTWRTHWRGTFYGMEVLCPHGIGHPPAEKTTGGAHGCDGCCSEKEIDMENSKPMVQVGAPGDEQTYQVRQGGLMRCCLLTLARYHETTAAKFSVASTPEGDVLPCASCNNSMVFTQGGWEWNKAQTDYTLRSASAPTA